MTDVIHSVTDRTLLLEDIQSVLSIASETECILPGIDHLGSVGVLTVFEDLFTAAADLLVRMFQQYLPFVHFDIDGSNGAGVYGIEQNRQALRLTEQTFHDIAANLRAVTGPSSQQSGRHWDHQQILPQILPGPQHLQKDFLHLPPLSACQRGRLDPQKGLSLACSSTAVS